MKREFRNCVISLFFLLFCMQTIKAEDRMLSILKDELQREMKEFKASNEMAPYFISYRVSERNYAMGESVFGMLYNSNKGKERFFQPMIRVGSYQKDNYHETSTYRSSNYRGSMLPIEINDDTEDAVRLSIWNNTNSAYRNAVQIFEAVKSEEKTKVANEDKSDDYTVQKAERYVEKPLDKSELTFDTAAWNQRIVEYSAIFKEFPEILQGHAYYEFQVIRKYYVSSEGVEVVENERYARLFIEALVMADDGMQMPLYLSYFAFSPKDLELHETILKETREMAEKLIQLRTAPVVDSYTGPAILAAPAAGVFFHEIFGHRIEGQRLKSENDGQTFKKKVGELVLPQHISVIMDPTLKTFDKKDLNGYYVYDDEGVKAEKVDVVKDGILKGFLMSRTAIDGFSKSNGHGRADFLMDPVTRQSNLIVKTSDPKTSEELRTILKEEAKKQGKEYGYFFAEVSGGFTQTGRYNPNSFNVTPLEVYRVYVDNRPDELVRGVSLIGTPLSMFGQIQEVGDKAAIFTGMCGAESGSIPVTGISPDIFVKVIETQKNAKSNEKQPLLPRPEITNK